MKFLKLLFLLVTAPLFLFSCDSQDSGKRIEIQCDEFFENPHISEKIEVGVGDEFSVNLCSNASTGFQWIETVEISDPGVVEQLSHQFIGPSENDDSTSLGTPGSQLWRFKTIQEGTSTLSFEYSRAWEGGEKGEWTFTLTVH